MLDGHIHRYFPERFDYGGRTGMNIDDSVPKDVVEDIGTPRWVVGVHFQMKSTGEGDVHGGMLEEAAGRWNQTSEPLTYCQALEVRSAYNG